MLNRRDFVRNAALLSAGLPLAASKGPAAVPPAEAASTPDEKGSQRLPLEKLRRWEGLGYGMFIHFGMSTYIGRELPDGTQPQSLYAPHKLDVDQWVSVARDAGMKYAVLTAKHVAGHCLWPTKWTDYHVGNSPVKTDVVEAFVAACAKRGVLPGLYYCSWDNHNRFGSVTPTDVYRLPADEQVKGPYGWSQQAFTTRAYQDFQWRQIEELMTRYGPIMELWIDIPGVLPRAYRNELYRQVAAWQPDTYVMMNSGDHEKQFPVTYAWPQDLTSMERSFPPSYGYEKWRQIEGGRYYVPAEVCETLRKNWFFVPDDPLRADHEVLAMHLLSRARGANLLLDVPPDGEGLFPDDSIQALMRLRANLDRLGVA